jgi:hypothetical protein
LDFFKLIAEQFRGLVPGKLGGFGVKAGWSRVVVEGMLGAFVDVELIFNAGGFQGRFIGGMLVFIR